MLVEAVLLWCCTVTPEVEIRTGLEPLGPEEFTTQSEGTSESSSPER